MLWNNMFLIFNWKMIDLQHHHNNCTLTQEELCSCCGDVV
jgi:hypothetical protein